MQTVQEFHLYGLVGVVVQHRAAYPTETVGCRPLIGESKSEVEVLFDKEQFVARHGFGDGAADIIQTEVAVGEGFPYYS